MLKRSCLIKEVEGLCEIRDQSAFGSRASLNLAKGRPTALDSELYIAPVSPTHKPLHRVGALVI